MPLLHEPKEFYIVGWASDLAMIAAAQRTVDACRRIVAASPSWEAGVTKWSYDFKNARHVVLQTFN